MAKHPYHDLVTAFDQLPGIGKKAAARLADTCLDRQRLGSLAKGSIGPELQAALTKALASLELCSHCHYWKVDGFCHQCDAEPVTPKVYCVVETIDQANQLLAASLPARFLVLHGVLSPTSGVGPDQLNMKNVIAWLQALPARHPASTGWPETCPEAKPQITTVGEANTDARVNAEAIRAMSDSEMTSSAVKEPKASQANSKVPVIVTLPDSVEGQMTTEFLQRSINKQRDDIECRRQPFDQFLSELLSLHSSVY